MVTWPFAFFAFDLTFKSKQKQTVMSACKKKANESKISTKSASLDLGKPEGFEAESVWTGCGGRYDEKKDYALRATPRKDESRNLLGSLFGFRLLILYRKLMFQNSEFAVFELGRLSTNSLN